MYFYFSSDFPSVVKLDGIYYGIINDNLKPINIENGSSVFVEVCFLNSKACGVNFLLDENFLSCPPLNVLVVDLRGGYMLKFLPPQEEQPFCLLSQEKTSNLLVTVFKENGLKVSIETPLDFCLEQFSLNVDSAKICTFTLSGNNFVGITFLGKDQYSAVYKIGEKIEKVLFRPASLTFENGQLKTEQCFLDMAKHQVISSWEYLDGKLTETDRKVSAKKCLRAESLPSKLVPYAFLEELLVGGDYKEYLCDNVKENADKLKDYLGDFVGVFPPPVFRSIDEVGIVYSYSNAYNVQYLTFTLDCNKIFNIKKSAD